MLAPLLAVLDDLREFLGIEILDDVEDAVNRDISVGLLTLIVSILALLVFGALFGLVLQTAREVLTNWDLRLTRRMLDAICDGFRRLGVDKVRTLLGRDNHLVLSFFRSQGMMAAPFIPLEKALGER